MADSSSLLGFEISSRGLDGDVSTALGWLKSREQGGFMACANPHSLVVANRDPLTRLALLSADLLLPDGVGVVHASRMFGCPVPGRVIGYDFFIRFTEQMAATGGGRYFFLGASTKALQLISRRMAREYPAITICGKLAPSFNCEFSADENKSMVEAINRAEPDVLWVGMTAPKQEKWVQQHRHLLQVPCIGAIGAVFDFYSGIKHRPPLFWQRIGLEWLYRLCREPARLWERTVISAPVFVWLVLKTLLRQKLSRSQPSEASDKQCRQQRRPAPQ